MVEREGENGVLFGLIRSDIRSDIKRFLKSVVSLVQNMCAFGCCEGYHLCCVQCWHSLQSPFVSDKHCKHLIVLVLHCIAFYCIVLLFGSFRVRLLLQLSTVDDSDIRFTNAFEWSDWWESDWKANHWFVEYFSLSMFRLRAETLLFSHLMAFYRFRPTFHSFSPL